MTNGVLNGVSVPWEFNADFRNRHHKLIDESAIGNTFNKYDCSHIWTPLLSELQSYLDLNKTWIAVIFGPLWNQDCSHIWTPIKLKFAVLFGPQHVRYCTHNWTTPYRKRFFNFAPGRWIEFQLLSLLHLHPCYHRHLHEISLRLKKDVHSSVAPLGCLTKSEIGFIQIIYFIWLDFLEWI